MKEILEIYNLKGKFLKNQERKAYYSQIKKKFEKTGKISTKIKTIKLFLMNSNGRIYLQKRSNLKSENSGLYDKTIGGHVLKRETYDMTVVRECAEELGFPASILTDKEFNSAIKNIDLQTVGLFKQVGKLSNFLSVRIAKGRNDFIQPQIAYFYIGYYNGAIKFADGEASGIEVFSLKELKDEINNNPAKFTEDLKYMVKKFEKFLKPV